MGYIITEGQDPNTYTGYRAATPDMDVNEGEQFVESLEGWSPFIPSAPPKTPQEKLGILTSLIAQLDEQKQANLLQSIPGVYLALQAGNVNVARLAIQNIPIGEDAELAGLRAMVLGILED